MKGAGSSSYRPHYTSSSSNLPTVSTLYGLYHRSDVSEPFLASEESADGLPLNHFPVSSRPYGYDFFREMDSTPPTDSYGSSNLRYIEPISTQLPRYNSMGLASQDTCDYNICSGSIKTLFVDAEPNYPSNTAPIHDGSSSVSRSHLSPSSSVFAAHEGSTLGEYTKQSSEISYSGQGCYLWNQSAEFQDQGKQVELEGSFSSKETCITGSFVEGNLVNQVCHDAKQSDDVQVLHSNKIGWEKHGVPSCRGQLDNRSCWWQTSKSFPVDASSMPIQGSPSMALEAHYDSPHGSYDKYLRQRDKPFWFDLKSPAPMTGLIKDLNLGSHTADRDHCSNIFSNNLEAYPMPSSGNTGHFDSSQLHTCLKTNDPIFSTASEVPSDKSVSRNVTDLVFKAGHEFQNHQLGLDNINLTHDTIEGVNSVEKSSDNLDQCNPAVDSPCWAGVPAAHHSPLKVYTVACPEYGRKPGGHFPSNSNKNQVQREIDNQEKGLEGLPRKFPVMNCASEECHLDGAMNDGHFQYKTNCDFALQQLDDLSKTRESNVPLSQSFHGYEAGSSDTKQQVIQENKLTSPKELTVHRSCADTGINVNDCLEPVTSYAAEHAAELALSSPSAQVAPGELETATGKVSSAKINVQMLVDTMHNLSELLLFHCLNDACELKEQDKNGLKNVISNLDTCISKNAEQMFPQQEGLFPHSDTSKCARESAELQQNSSFERPQLTKAAPECINPEHGNSRVQEENCHFVSGKQCKKLAYSLPTLGGAEMLREDNITEAIRRVLGENFHDEEGSEPPTLLYKNLWLKAEAELCSITYKARYNQMRIEMEKYSDKQNGAEELSKLEVVPNLSTSPRYASKLDTSQNPSSEDVPVLSAANLKEPSGFKFSPDLNKPCPLAAEVKDGQNLNSFAQDSPASSISNDAGNYEASVMARFHVLQSQVDNSHIGTGDLEDVSSCEVSPALDKGDEIASVGRDRQDQVIITKGSTMPGKDRADFETSVMARFNLLKSRLESSNCMVPSVQVLDELIFPPNGTNDMEPIPSHLTSCTASDELDASNPEFIINLEDDEEIQSHVNSRFGNPLHMYHSDGFSSDWEQI